MPAVSQSQRRLFGAAYAYKKGKKSGSFSKAKALAERLSGKTLKEFATTVKKGE